MHNKDLYLFNHKIIKYFLISVIKNAKSRKFELKEMYICKYDKTVITIT
jgi:hypothetical protein